MNAVGITVTGVFAVGVTWVDVVDLLSDEALKGLTEAGCPVRAGLRLVNLTSEPFSGTIDADGPFELRYEARFEVIT